MKCTKCGREIPDNVRFCKYCGNTTDSSHVAKQNADVVFVPKAAGLYAGGKSILLHGQTSFL